MKKILIGSLVSFGLILASQAFAMTYAPATSNTIPQTTTPTIQQAQAGGGDYFPGVNSWSDQQTTGSYMPARVMINSRFGNELPWFGLMVVITIILIWVVLLLLIAILWHYLKSHKIHHHEHHH